jgi:hypothetical protein
MIFSSRRPRLGAVVFIIVCLALFSMLPAYATSESTDYQLLSDAYAAYGKGDWLQAALLFSAYLDRAPALLQQDAQRRQNIEACYAYARSRLQNGLVAAGDLPGVRQDLSACQSNLQICQTGSGTRGSFIKIPTPTPPAALPLASGAAGAPSYPLVCRGGGGLYFTYAPYSRFSPRPQMWIRYEKAPSPVGMDREDIDRLDPGECAWLDRAVASSEPDVIQFREPLFDAGQFTISWSEGEVMGTSSGAPYTSLQRPDRYVTFLVYNDRQGNFVVTDVRDCTPGPDEVAVFTDSHYHSSCRVLPVGNYLSSQATGQPNDTISSVMVGSAVRAYLCQDQNLRGTCEFLSIDDPDLSDNNIGNDRVTSVRVEQRGACIPGPGEVALFMQPNYQPPCELKPVGRYDTAEALGLPNDSISSVRVGTDVTLTLCMHGSQTAPCELFAGDDPNLSDNAIGNDQATSGRVQPR